MAKIHIGGKKYLHNKDADALHLGRHIRAFLDSKGITKAELAARTDRNNNTVHETLKRPSMQTGVLWEYCHAVRHNFFADIAAALPADYESATQTQMAMEIENLKRERDILMALLKK